MSQMGDLMIDLQDELEFGVLTFDQIAEKYEVPVSWVQEAAELMLARVIAEQTLE